jgi:mannose-6-phosphate isomerase-like protein (cupin superfamily)
MSIKVIQTFDVEPERMEERDGWAISEFRLPITGETGSATTVFHSIFRPGSTHAKHLHEVSDEIAVYLSGYGVVGQGDSRAVVSAGHCRLMPMGSTHFFYNETQDEDAKVIGFYMGAPDVAGTGYQFCGTVTEEDLQQPREGLNEGILIRLEDAGRPVELPAAWDGLDVRAPIGTHNGSPNSLVHVAIPAGGELAAHALANAEAIYYVASGSGEVSGRIEGGPNLSEDSFVFVPRGETHAIRNTGADVLEMYVVLTGAGGLTEAL